MPKPSILDHFLSNLICCLGALPFLAYFLWLHNKEGGGFWLCAIGFVLAWTIWGIYHEWRPAFSRAGKYSRAECFILTATLIVGVLSPAVFQGVRNHHQRIAFADSHNVNERLVGLNYQLRRLDHNSQAYRDLVGNNLDYWHFEVRQDVLVHLLGVENSVREPFLPKIQRMAQNDHSESVQNWAKLVLRSVVYDGD